MSYRVEVKHKSNLVLELEGETMLDAQKERLLMIFAMHRVLEKDLLAAVEQSPECMDAIRSRQSKILR